MIFTPTNPLSFRSVTDEDKPFIRELFVSARALTFDNLPLPEDQKQVLIEQQFNSMHDTYAREFPNGIHLLVLRRKKPIGRVYTNETADELRLLDIIIHPKMRSKGVGSQLMEQMIAHAEAQEKDIRFYVWENNTPAQRFYERHGFQHVDTNGPYLLFERKFKK